MKKGLLYSVLTALLFVTLEPVSKLIAGEVTPYAITFWRFVIGSIILIPFAIVKIRKEKLKITGKDLLIMVGLGILFICFSMILLQLAVKEASAPSLIAIIFSSNSVFTLLLAIPLVKERMTKNKLLALIFCVIGLLFCVDFSQGTGALSVLLALLASVSFSLYAALSQKYMTKLGSAVQTCFVFLLGSCVLLIGLLIMGVDVLPSFNLKSVSILLYLGLFVTGVGYWAYFKAIEKGGAIMGSLAFFIKPILTPFVALLINGTKLSWNVFAAVLLVAFGSFWAIREKTVSAPDNSTLKSQ